MSAFPELAMVHRITFSALLTGSLLAGCATVPPPSASTVSAPVQSSSQGPATDATAELVPSSTMIQPEAAVPPPVHMNLQEFVDRNDDKLLQAYVGMSRQGVERLMAGQRSGAYTNPFRQQSISLGDGKRYDVLYYLTRAPRAGHGITEIMLTPVILKNDRVVAIGRYPLKKLRRGECPASKPSVCQ